MQNLAQTSNGMINRSGVNDDRSFVALWLGKRAKNANTHRAYASVAWPFLSYLGELGCDLRGCTVADLESWVGTLSGLSDGTKRQRISIIKSLFSLAKSTGYCMFNVASILEQPKVQNQLAERILTEEEVFRLFELAPPRTELLLRLLYVTGARISELADLRWEHVHQADDGSAVVTIHGKGSKTRHVPIDAKHMAWFPPRAEPTDYVYQTRTGRRLNPGSARNMIAAVTKKDARFKGRNISPHWLRHSHATHALNRGAQVHTVQAILGHASVATTSRYLHASPKEGTAVHLAT